MSAITTGGPPTRGRNGNGASCLAAITAKQPQLISRPDENLPHELPDATLRRDLQLAISAVELALVEHMPWEGSYVICQERRRALAAKYAGQALLRRLLGPSATKGGGQ